jgi:hypothetical protein
MCYILTEELLSFIEKTISILFKNFSFLGFDALQSKINVSTF